LTSAKTQPRLKYAQAYSAVSPQYNTHVINFSTFLPYKNYKYSTNT